MKAKSKKIIVYVVVGFIFSGLFSYIFVLASSYSINPLFPVPKDVKQNFLLTYPPSTNKTLPVTWFTVSFNLESNELVSEGVNMNVTNEGGIFFSKNFAFEVQKILVGFKHALPLTTIWDNTTGQSRTFNGPYGIWLEPNFSKADGVIVPIKSTNPSPAFFYFPSAGTYHPKIIVGLNNGTYLTHTYDEIDLPVISKAELRTQLFDQINVFIAIALLVFTLVESIKTIHNWKPRDDDEKDSDFCHCELSYVF